MSQNSDRESSANYRVLIVDGDQIFGKSLMAELARRGIRGTQVGTADKVSESLGAIEVDALVTELDLSGENGLDLCRRIGDDRPDLPVVVLTKHCTYETAIAAMRAGAFDLQAKRPEMPALVDDLILALDRAVARRKLKQSLVRLRGVTAKPSSPSEMIGSSPAMANLRNLVQKVAVTDATVLIAGESGTGKELVARAIHRASRRAQGPFKAINCAALPETLFESELFGHAKGAFTDAKENREGLMLQARGGTLFLDEIGEMPLAMQSKLLRAIQERVLRPVGGQQEIPFDLRIVTATNRDLEAAVRKGTFRDDLYFRIHVIQVEVPPLRGRGNDVLELAQYFIERFAAQLQRPVIGLSAAAAERIAAHNWPGNVRELQNCVERAVALAAFEEILVEDLPDQLRRRVSTPLPVPEDESSSLDTIASGPLVSLDEVERRHILKVLEAVGHNKRLAARTLGLDRKTLYRKLALYGVFDADIDRPAS